MYKIKLLIISSILATTALYANEIDPTTDLIVDSGLDQVKENCTICHTGRFIVVNGGDKQFWKAKMKTMQSAYGLWEIDEKSQERMLNYLAKNYSQKVNITLDD
ncbi:hypothetical protein KKC13_05705 [bacterium]|nr:hypothetical protein [bacterium]MBU1957344.1 hypothetical protein [bacterium]